MKKIGIFVAAIALGFSSFAQPVSDRAVVPVAVTLNQILRLAVTNGGNIEFVFNRIDQYENGIANSAAYDTNIDVASSTRWTLSIGAEDATFIGTDDPTQTLALANVGYQIISDGAHAFGTELTDPAGANAAVVVLTGFPTVVIGSAAAPNGNSGDAADNTFTINWEANTATVTAASGLDALIDQDNTPDRYVTNVLMDIAIAP